MRKGGGVLEITSRKIVLQRTSRNQGSELSSATMIPQMTVVAGLTHSKEELSMKPAYAVGDYRT